MTPGSILLLPVLPEGEKMDLKNSHSPRHPEEVAPLLVGQTAG